MAVFFTESDAVKIVLTGSGSWERRDLNSDYGSFPADVTGVMLVFDSGSTSPRNIGARPYNDTDFTDITTMLISGRSSAYIKCDSNQEIEVYRSSTLVDVYLVGYFTTDATWLAAPIDITPGSTGSYVSTDLSSYTSDGDLFAIVEGKNSTFNYGISVQYNNATDNRTPGTQVGHWWAIIPLDGNDFIDCYIENITASNQIDLIGFLSSGTKRTTGGSDIMHNTTGSYADITMPDSGKEIAILEIYDPNAEFVSYGLQPNGSTTYPDMYADIYRYAGTHLVSIDGSDLAESKIEDTDIACYVWGYLAEVSGASATLTGTAVTGGVTESEIVTGGDTIISTLTGETYVSGTTSEDAIVAGLNGGTSWNSEVRDNLDNTNIVLSVGDTVATITLPASAGYSISANDTVILTIPAASLTASTSPIVATPNIIVTNEGAVLLTNYYYQLLLAGEAA